MSRKTYHHALPIGTTIENYEITDVLGAGGFGITYKGHDNDLNCAVAIKEYLPTSLAIRRPDGTTVIAKSDVDTTNYEYGLKRFMDEARTLALFKEPNIVRVFRFFRANGTAYLVMEYEDGQALSVFLRMQSKPLSEDQIKAIIIPILDGLRAVHAQHYLHRDIKPGNIYLRKTGSPVLLDFGAARQALVGQSQSLTGVVTPGYGPFEQYNTRGKQGPWTDLYAIGATMYRCVTNKMPPDAPDRIAALQENEPDPILPAVEAGKGRYSEEFLRTIDWMLSPNLRKRPQSVKEALDSLVPDRSSDKPQAIYNDNSEEPTRISGAPTRKVTFSIPFLKIAVVAAVLLVSGFAVKHFWPIIQTNTSINSDKKSVVASKTDDKSKTKPLIRNPPATTMLDKAKTLFTKKDNKAAVELLRKLAANGNAEAQMLLGNAYFRGTGIDKNHEEALYWYRKAAKQGYAQAQTNLGVMHKFGWGTKKNTTKAVKWFHKAARHNNGQAQNYLGNMYFAGDGVGQDVSRAIVFYRRAAKNGDPKAQISLGNIYFQGKNLPRSYATAAAWYTSAARHGNAQAQANLAYMFEKGLGVRKNPQKAIYWYRKALNNGHKKARAGLHRLHAG
jgi:serine/threonine protein kinase